MLQIRGVRKPLSAALVALAVIGCNLQFVPSNAAESTPVTPPSNQSEAASPTAIRITETASPTGTAAATETLTPTAGPAPVVTVSASGGRLNIRRGPGPEYDFVGALLDGQSATATGRNADGSWLLINAPNSSKTLGWVIVTTKYTTVEGEAPALPRITVGPALPAFIRNCTGNEMLVNPVGAILQARNSAPDNQQQFFPGEYVVIDTTTETEVASVTVLEGRTIDIKQDGGGANHNCP